MRAEWVMAHNTLIVNRALVRIGLQVIAYAHEMKDEMMLLTLHLTHRDTAYETGKLMHWSMEKGPM